MNHVLLAIDWVEIIRPMAMLLAVAFWLYHQLNQAQEENQEPPKQRREPAPRPRPVEAERQRAVADEEKPARPERQDAIRDEVEEFLRRSREQRQHRTQDPVRQADASRPKQPRIEVLVDDEGAAPAPARPAPPEREREEREPRRSARADAAAAAAAAAVTAAEKQGGSVAASVERHLRHLAESQLAERASQFGSQVASADDRLEARLHEKFDHQLGKLGKRPEEESAQGEQPSPAVDFASLLATPQGMQQAIVLNEILQRPTHRW